MAWCLIKHSVNFTLSLPCRSVYLILKASMLLSWPFAAHIDFQGQDELGARRQHFSLLERNHIISPCNFLVAWSTSFDSFFFFYL
jgi:hypothetical protein